MPSLYWITVDVLAVGAVVVVPTWKPSCRRTVALWPAAPLKLPAFWMSTVTLDGLTVFASVSLLSPGPIR